MIGHAQAGALRRRKVDTRAQLARGAGRALIYVIAVVAAMLFMIPFFWTLSSSLKTPGEVFVFPPTWIPTDPRPDNYVQVWQKVPFASFTLNTVTVTVLAMVGQVVSASAVAYGFARFRFRGRNLLFMLVLSTMMIPREVTIIPSFLLFKYVGWLDTLAPLIVPHYFGGGAFFIFLMRQFLMTIPMEFDEAAKMDGATSVDIFFRILLPLAKPAMATIAVFSFLGHWNEFLEPLIYLNTPERYTLALGLRWFQQVPMDASEPREHLLMAASITMTLPCIVLFFAAQKYFVRGIVMSGIKG